MKYKRDYKIHIQADSVDCCYWSATVKGEHKSKLSCEDYQTILQMLDDVRRYISSAIEDRRIAESR